MADGERVLSADYSAEVRLRGRLEVEIALCHALVNSDLEDPEPRE
jgi:hypothetical protein